MGNYDVSVQLANQCSLHSCSSNEHCHRTSIENPGYTSHSPSNDTLWDAKSEQSQSCNRQAFKQRPSSVYHPSTSTANHSYIQHRYVHPSQVQPIQSSITTTHAYIPPQYNHNRPKSWDNLAKNSSNSAGNYAIGAITNNGYIKYHPTSGTSSKQAIPQQQQHVLLPRKANQAPYGRYSTFTEVENYVPAPQAFVQAETITKTTIITTTKSTENLINNAQYDDSCECLAVSSSPQQQQQQQCSPKPILASNCAACNAAGNFASDQSYQGYYSNLTRNNNNSNRYIPTKTEITRL